VIVTGAGGGFCDMAWPPFGAMLPSGAEFFDDAAEVSLAVAEFGFCVWLGLRLQATPNISSKLTANTAIRNLIWPPSFLTDDDGLEAAERAMHGSTGISAQ
jgi:hypothetical protein